MRPYWGNFETYGGKRDGLGTVCERSLETKKGVGMAKHRATGNPRGRPPRIPFDFGQRIMENLRGRVDPKTGLVRPFWKQMARELGVSRSTIARQMAVGEDNPALAVLHGERDIGKGVREFPHQLHRGARLSQEVPLEARDCRLRDGFRLVSLSFPHERIIHFLAFQIQAWKLRF